MTHGHDDEWRLAGNDAQWLIAGTQRPDGGVRLVASSEIPVASIESRRGSFHGPLELRLVFRVDQYLLVEGATYEEALARLFGAWKPPEPERRSLRS